MAMTNQQLSDKIDKLITCQSTGNKIMEEKIEELEERFNRVMFGVNGSGGGIEGRLKSVEDFIADAKKVLWIIVGLVATAVVVNIINIIVTHWK